MAQTDTGMPADLAATYKGIDSYRYYMYRDVQGGTMGFDPTSLSLAWSPFGNHDASAKDASSAGLRLGGLASAPLRFSRAPDSVSLTSAGEVRDKTVISEVTTVDIRSMSAYTVETKSASDAKKTAQSSTTIDSTVRADGNVDVATTDESKQSTVGSIVVSTTVTYADGSTQTTSASLTSGLKSTGDGLARKRLESIVGGSLSIDAILEKLGLTSPQDAHASAGISAKTAVDAHVNTDIGVSLTYIQTGDQRLVHGTEEGTANAVIANFLPTDLTYGAGGLLSKTNESVRFSGTINGGSLFSDSSSAWLSGSMSESTNTSTHIAGSSDISIARQSTATFDFNTNPASSFIASHVNTSTQITATTGVSDGRGGSDYERLTWSESQSDGSERFTDLNGVASTNQSLQSGSISITSTPNARATAAGFCAVAIAPARSFYA